MQKQRIEGCIIEEAGVTPWPHERHSAKALASVGYKVKFIPSNDTFRSADVYLNNTQFEMKAPQGYDIQCIERNIKRALKKCPNIVIDSCRMKRVQDRSIQNKLISRYRARKGIKRLLFVKRNGEVVCRLNIHMEIQLLSHCLVYSFSTCFGVL